MKWTLLLAPLVVATVPAALAEAGYTHCWGGETVPATVEAPGRAYVTQATLLAYDVWEESNGLAGLQKTDRYCNNGEGTLTVRVQQADAYEGRVQAGRCVMIGVVNYCVA